MSPLASYVVQTLVTLVAIVALAVLVLYGARRVGVGRSSGPILLVGKLPLDARRALYLVRVGKTVYVVGASEAGLNKLGELSEAELLAALPEGEPSGDASFSEALGRILGRPRSAKTKTSAESGEAERSSTGADKDETDAA